MLIPSKLNQLSDDLLTTILLLNLAPEDIGKLIIVLATSTREASILQIVTNNRHWENKVKRHFPVEFSQLNPALVTDWYIEFANIYTQTYINLPSYVSKLMSATKENNLKASFNLYDTSITQGHRLLLAFAAAERGHINALKTLCQAGVDFFSSADGYGMTISHIAAQHGQVEIFKKIKQLTHIEIDYSAMDAMLDMMFPDSVSFEPLPEVIETPGNSSPAPQMEHHMYNDPIEFMEEINYLNAKNHWGKTPAFLAAENGHDNVLQVLDELGANLKKRNNDGVTPFYAAIKEGHLNVVNYFLSQPEHRNALNLHAESFNDPLWLQLISNKIPQMGMYYLIWPYELAEAYANPLIINAFDNNVLYRNPNPIRSVSTDVSLSGLGFFAGDTSNNTTNSITTPENTY